MKNQLMGVFESFLDDHKEYTAEHKDRKRSTHKPRYQGINTTADNEYKVLNILCDLNETELTYLRELLNDQEVLKNG